MVVPLDEGFAEVGVGPVEGLAGSEDWKSAFYARLFSDFNIAHNYQ